MENASTNKLLLRQRAEKILSLLKTRYPHRKVLLRYESPFQLLIATILSAQTTDIAVNKATVHLFSKYPNARNLASASVRDVEHIIHSLGFYRVKAKHIIHTAKCLSDGMVPRSMNELVKLPGVGRKSASVILAHIHHVPAIIIDTHMLRVCKRMGVSRQRHAAKMEQDLAQLLDQCDWIDFSMAVNFHGRECCYARNPRCDECSIVRYCEYYESKEHELEP